MTESVQFRIPARELCAFTAKGGDLDLRFAPSPSARQGIAGHAVVTARRGAAYLREVPLVTEQGVLRIAGRADGFDETNGILEEIKTYRGALDRIPDNHRRLHWAQLKLYGAMLCRTRGLETLTLQLTYFNVDSGIESPLLQRCTSASLDAFFTEHTERFSKWALQEQAHRMRREGALAALSFPRPAFNAGQRELSVAVYRTALKGGTLLVEAPTGIGKTLGTLFPALKAAAGKRIDKIFYLTAKTPGRAVALDALRSLQSPGGADLRVLELTARKKACVHPGLACHGESCPLARGFFDRLAGARAAAVTLRWLDKDGLDKVAALHQVCPYFLGQELIRWADVVVGDYNYYFDTSAALHTLTVINEWDIVLLVDEAHNLVDRVRTMYSKRLSPSAFQAVRRGETGDVRRALDRLNRAWNKIGQGRPEPEMVLDTIPARFVDALGNAVAVIGAALAEGSAADASPQLLDLFFELGAFARLVDSFGEHSLFVVEFARHAAGHSQPALTIQNVVPAVFLKPRLDAARSAIFFSATLGPTRYFRDMTGVDAGAVELHVSSPFHADQLEVRIAPVSTRRVDRDGSTTRIAELVLRQVARRPGNYLAFLSSYEYTEQVYRALLEHAPAFPVWRQQPRMTEDEREAFLERFETDGRGVGLAVLGGAFGEGIDLAGRRLVGAFIATLGLPQINVVNDAMRTRVDHLFGHGTGFDYIYRYPGLRRVVQAAGRVIRTRTDTGTVVLIDDRFAHAEIRRLLPHWWASPIWEARVSR